MIVGNNRYASCYGEGEDGWLHFMSNKAREVEWPYPDQFAHGFSTGVCMDVTPGLFSYDSRELLKHFLREDGTYPTGVCLDYDDNWMLRRVLWTDADGTEHVAEGTVATSGRILSPVQIKERRYEPDTVYPLNGSWTDVWRVAGEASWNPWSYDRERSKYVNLVVPFSFFEYLQHDVGEHCFTDLSSRTFFTALEPDGDGNILMNSIFDNVIDDDDAYDVDDYYVPLNGIISLDGKIIEPLHISIDGFMNKHCFQRRYGRYVEGIKNLPKPWLGEEDCTN